MKSFLVQSVICRRRKQERRHQKWKESKWCTVPGPGQWAEFQSEERTAHTHRQLTLTKIALQQLRVSNHCQVVRYGMAVYVAQAMVHSSSRPLHTLTLTTASRVQSLPAGAPWKESQRYYVTLLAAASLRPCYTLCCLRTVADSCSSLA